MSTDAVEPLALRDIPAATRLTKERGGLIVFIYSLVNHPAPELTEQRLAELGRGGFRAKDGHALAATVDETGRVKSLTDARMRTVKVGWNAAGLPESWEEAVLAIPTRPTLAAPAALRSKQVQLHARLS